MKLPTLLKKSILSFLIALSLLVSVAPSMAYAQQPGEWYNQSFSEWYQKVYDPNDTSIFGERYTAAQVQWIFYRILAIPLNFVKYDFINCFFSGTVSCITNLIVSAPQTSALAKGTEPQQGIISFIFSDRPLSGITYIKNIGRKFHIIPEAQAQSPGFGFGAFDPILPLWRASRNIAYALLVLVTLVFAFMIMFRVKISPQVVISVQSALPKLVLTIILVTFSYAIAGFLVDLMYVVIGLAGLFLSSYTNGNPAELFATLTKGRMLGVDVGLIGLFINYLGGFVFTFGIIFFTSTGVVFTLVGLLASALVGIFFAATGLFQIAFLLSALVLFIIFLAIVWHFIKIMWMLFKAFANLLLLTIFAPFQLALGTLIPALDFSSWLKSFVSNLSIFVLTGVLFELANIFLIMAFRYQIQDLKTGDTISKLLAGTVLQNAISNPTPGWPPLLGTGSQSAIAMVMLGTSLVLFLTIPKLAEILQSFAQGKPFAYGTAIGESLGPIAGAAGFVWGGVQKGGQQFIADRGGKEVTGFIERIRGGTGQRTTAGGTGARPPGI